MKLWVLHDGWDYHEQAEWVVMAETREEAWTKLLVENPKPETRKEEGGDQRLAEMSDLVEQTSDVYQNPGCDC